MALQSNNLTCTFCMMEFSSISTKNRHIRNKHAGATSQETDELSTEEIKTRTKHIICPICPNKISFSFHRDLIIHLTNSHHVTIRKSILNFRNLTEFALWRSMENKEVGYALVGGTKNRDGDETKIYECNRSNYRGYVSCANLRRIKFGGSIHIQGTCPSRIVVNISANGSVTVNFVESHVGHTDELRSNKTLPKEEHSTINVGQLPEVLHNRIIQNSKINQDDKLKRSNLVTTKKVIIDKKKDADDLFANARKIEPKEIHVLYTDEPSTIQIQDQDNGSHFIQETRLHTETTTFKDKREIALREVNNFARSLDEESFNKFAYMLKKFKSDMEQQQYSEVNRKKIKIEKQML